MEKKRLGYNIELEYAVRLAFGRKYYNYASLFEDPTNVKSALKDWINKIEKRLYTITNYDENLRGFVSTHLESLRRNLAQYPKESNEWKIIADLVAITTYLVGYSYDGELNRHVIYYQDAQQQVVEARHKAGSGSEDLWGFNHIKKYRKDIAHHLKEAGLTNYQISLVLTVSLYEVNQLLKD